MSRARADSRYLLRLDDACSTMPRGVWDRLEVLLAEIGVMPIVAVIPDNRDEKMLLGDPDPRFWRRVRRWQERGWSIGIHGLHHEMTKRGRRKTEFAGVPAARQQEMIDTGLGIFARERVRPDAWIAPNHSFDRTTVGILASRQVDVISDGNAIFPYRDSAGVIWVPQQLWRFEERSTGVWTVCKHPNGWEDQAFSQFESEVRRFADRMTDLRSVVEAFGGRRRDIGDLMFSTRRRAKRTALLGLRWALGRWAMAD